MTQPPYDTGPGSTPPGFGPPGQTPWRDGKPLAAAHTVSSKRFVVAMAFFGALLLVSVVGFVLTREDSPATQVTEGPFNEGPFTEETPRVTRPPRASREPRGPGPVPKPIVYRGSGVKVLKIRRPEPGDALVYIKASPPANGLLTISGVAGGGAKNGLIITSTDAYEGVRVLDVTSFSRTESLEIEAAGPWVVEIRSPRSAKAFTGSVAGAGDAVLRYTGPAGTARLRGGAQMEPFTIFTRTKDFPRLIATGLGPFDAEKIWPKGPVLVEVQATGRWSIRVT